MFWLLPCSVSFAHVCLWNCHHIRLCVCLFKFYFNQIWHESTVTDTQESEADEDCLYSKV